MESVVIAGARVMQMSVYWPGDDESPAPTDRAYLVIEVPLESARRTPIYETTTITMETA